MKAEAAREASSSRPLKRKTGANIRKIVQITFLAVLALHMFDQVELRICASKYQRWEHELQHEYFWLSTKVQFCTLLEYFQFKLFYTFCSITVIDTYSY